MSETCAMLPWQKALASAITDPAALLQILQLNPALLPQAQAAARQFPLRVPQAFVARMQRGDPSDPLLLQVLPLHAELRTVTGYSTDPLGEKAANPLPGLLHKYRGRVLVMLTGACAVHCRYCFRREFSYADNIPDRSQQTRILNYIRAQTDIHEVILSGGDPLAAPDKVIQTFADALRDIPHVHTLRFHTRLPVVLPGRITPAFSAWLADYPLRKVVVMHCNHPQEIDDTVVQAIQQLQQGGALVFNQSVLLKQVNDDAAVLIRLSEKLFQAGVLPYYLHMLDKVQGAAHFAVSLARARRLYKELQENLPGYLVPTLVREVAGYPHKVRV